MHITGRTPGRVDHEHWGRSPPGSGPHGPRAFSTRGTFAKVCDLSGKLRAPRGPRRLSLGSALTRGAPALSFEARYAELLRRDLFHLQQGLYPAQLLIDMPMQSYADSVPSALRSMPAWLLGAPQDAQLPPGQPSRREAVVHQRGAISRQLGLRARARALRLKGLQLATAGSVDMMRRQAVAPCVRYLRTCAPSRPTVLEVHLDGARTSLMVQASFPKADYQDLTLARPSPTARPDPHDRCVLPEEDGSVDLVLCSFVLHRLSCSMTRKLLIEFARVLSPGGRLVLLDVLQRIDLEGIQGAQQPVASTGQDAIFRQHLSHDVQATLTDLGWRLTEVAPAFLAKVVVADKTQTTRAPGQS